MKDPRQILRLALITEKGATQREKLNQYIFDVHQKANKIEIKKAIEGTDLLFITAGLGGGT